MMSQQEWLKEPKASMYDQLLALNGVTNVEMFDYAEKGCGVYVEGGTDQDVADAISMHIYSWNCAWFVGDTEYKKEFFTAKWFRNYYKFNAKRGGLSK